MKKEYAYYNVGVIDVSQNKNNENLIDISVNFPQKYYTIRRDEIWDFCKAALPELLKGSYNMPKLVKALETDPIGTLKDILVGRSVIFVTEFSNYGEFFTAGFSGLVGITSMDIDGTLLAKNEYDLFKSTVTFEEKYPPITSESESNDDDKENEDI